MPFEPRFRITNAIAAALTLVERARGFLDAARPSDEWIAEAHASMHIEGTQLTRDQAERLWTGEAFQTPIPTTPANC